MAGTRIAEAFVAVSADMAGLSAGMRQGQAITSSAVNSMQRSLGGLQSMLGMIGVGVGFGAIIGGIRGTIQEAMVAEETQQRLSGAVKATGGAAGYSAKQLADYALELQNVTTYGDENIKEVMARLITFKKVSGETFKRTTELAMDLASAGFGSAQMNAIQLGKALEEPVRGMVALRRSGVSFTEAEKARIKALVESNRLHEAQALILDAVAGQVGGMSRELAKTPTGRIKQLTEATGDLREEIGTKLMPLMVRWKEVQFTITKAVLNFVDLAAPMIGGFADQWARLNESTGGFAASAAVAAASVATIVPVATKLFSAFKSGGMIASFFAPLLPFLPVILGVTAAVVAMGAAWKLAMQSSQAEGILAGLKDIWVNVQMLWTNVKSAADGIWQAISGAFGLATGSVTEAMGSAVASVVGFFQEVTYWLGAFSSNWPATWEIIKESSAIAMDWIGNLFGALADRWQTVLAAIVDISLVTWTSIAAALGAAFGAINWGVLGEAFGNLMKTWAAHSWGMIGGFSGVFTWLMDSWKDVLTRMLSAWQSYSMALPKALYAAIKSLASGGTIGDAFSAAISEGMKGVGDAMKGFGEVGAEAAEKFADGYSGAFGEAKDALGITQGIGESLASIGDEAGKAASAAIDAAMANVAAKMDKLKSEMAALAEAADTPELQARREALAKQIGDLAIEYDKQKAAKAAADAKAEEEPEPKPKPGPEDEPAAGKASSPFIGFAELNRKMQEAMLKDTIGNKQLDVAEEQLDALNGIREDLGEQEAPVQSVVSESVVQDSGEGWDTGETPADAAIRRAHVRAEWERSRNPNAGNGGMFGSGVMSAGVESFASSPIAGGLSEIGTSLLRGLGSSLGLTGTSQPAGANGAEITDVASNTAEANTLLGKLVGAVDVLAKKLEPKPQTILAGA